MVNILGELLEDNCSPRNTSRQPINIMQNIQKEPCKPFAT